MRFYTNSVGAWPCVLGRWPATRYPRTSYYLVTSHGGLGRPTLPWHRVLTLKASLIPTAHYTVGARAARARGNCVTAYSVLRMYSVAVGGDGIRTHVDHTYTLYYHAMINNDESSIHGATLWTPINRPLWIASSYQLQLCNCGSIFFFFTLWTLIEKKQWWCYSYCVLSDENPCNIIISVYIQSVLFDNGHHIRYWSTL